MQEYKKNQEKLIENENSIISHYNNIIMKTLTNHTKLMNTFDLMVKMLERLKTNPIFFVIIDYWENTTKNIIEISNETDFRNIIRIKMAELITIYKKSDEFDSELEYLSAMGTVFFKYDSITIDDRVFIFHLRNFIVFNQKEKNIIHTYLDIFGGGSVYDLVCEEFRIAINNYSNCFEEEIRNRKVNDRKLHSLLCNLNYKLFCFCEKLLLDIFFVEKFMDIMVQKFIEYHNKQNKKYKNLEEYVKFNILQENEFIKKYIDEKLVYKYYAILEDANKPQSPAVSS